jgi:hypothetical protein
MKRSDLDKLIEAVQKRMDEDDEEFYRTMQDVAQYGADQGVTGFIYEEDTVEFKYIKPLQLNDARMWRAVFANDNHPDTITIQNSLAWFALEEVANRVIAEAE